MSPSLDKQLCEKYPKIFTDRFSKPNESPISFGIQCGDGWYRIIDMLCTAMSYSYSTAVKIDKEDAIKYGIESPTDEAGERYYLTIEAPQVIVDQVKEKFGTLRFYYHLKFDQKIIELRKTGKYSDIQKVINEYHHYFDGMVHMATTLSAHTCEITGKEGEMHVSNGGKDGWYKVLNCEYAKSESFYVDRNYIPANMVTNDEEL